MMGADKCARRYRGKGAMMYDAKRQESGKWKGENEGVERLLPEDTRAVLDVPVGTGRFQYLYKERGIKVVGVDTSPDMLAEARRKGLKNVRLGDIRRLSKLGLDGPDNRFDAVVCVRLFAWFEPDEVRQALGEMAKMADVLIVNIRTKEGGPYCKNNSLWNHSRDDFRRWVEEIGYRIDETFHVGNKGNDIHRLVRTE
jgi:SAM-dependent methyltransferase